MRWIIACAACFAGAASAQEITECRERAMFGDRWASVECDIQNTAETAIASLRYSISISDPDRTIPWVEEGQEGSPPRRAVIPGGIEPGETVPVLLNLSYFPDRADPDAVEADVQIIEALDVNGDSIR